MLLPLRCSSAKYSALPCSAEKAGEVRVLLAGLSGVSGQQRVFGFGQRRQAQAAGEGDPVSVHGAVSRTDERSLGAQPYANLNVAE